MDPVFRLIHSADLHLGRRFGNLPEAARGRLIEARHQALVALAQAARTTGATDILLAGDTFDSETPSDPVWRQALRAMGAAPDLRWWLLPGNHDSLAAETLWTNLQRHAPPNLTLITSPGAVEIAPRVTLLAAPLERRRNARDLTDWMPGCATPEGHMRLGLAHGAVQDFAESGGTDDGIIAPDRAQTAGLDYLALGDWHGQMRLGPRTAYSGTPEADGFRHTGRGACLAVSLSPGALPVVNRIETGQFHWAEAVLPLVPDLDPVQALARLLPDDFAQHRDHLLKIRATGRATLAGQAALLERAQTLGPDFWVFSLELAGLDTQIDTADLEHLDHGGALRLAAEALARQAADPALAEAERRVAAGALNRLYSYLRDPS